MASRNDHYTLVFSHNVSRQCSTRWSRRVTKAHRVTATTESKNYEVFKVLTITLEFVGLKHNLILKFFLMKYFISYISVQKDSKMECGQKATGT
jgi:hypothetical protein